MFKTAEDHLQDALNEARQKYARAAQFRALSAVVPQRLDTDAPTPRVAILLDGLVAVRVIECSTTRAAAALAALLNARVRWG